MTPYVFVILLILNITSMIYTSDVSCPKVCVCRTRRVPKLGQTYFVNCKRNGFTKIPDLSSLKANGLPKRLDLSRNRIRVISKSDFPTGLNVAMLYLESNDNVRLGDDAFSNLADSLQFLSLQSIHLQFIKPFTFLRGLTKLEKLILNYNTQKDDGVVSANVFKGLGLTSLKDISMYNCHVTGMEEEAFSGAEHIQELDLTFNWLKNIPSAVRSLTQLKKLHLRFNHIKLIHRDSFQGMISLNEIILNENSGLEIVRGSFAGLENSLTSLSLKSCELDDVPYEGIGTLRKLETLNIGYNPLVHMSDKSLSGEYCLKTLEISKTLFPLRSDILRPQKDCIVTLYINDRGLTEIPRDFLINLSQLHYVSLKKNQISVLRSDSLKGMHAKGYDLSDNPVVKIEKGAFSGLGTGLTVGLERTNISDIHFVTEYEPKTFQKVEVEGSRLTCDCSVYEAMQSGEPWMLDGQCWIGEETKLLKDIEFKTFLKKNCTEDDKPNDSSKYAVKEENVQASVEDKAGLVDYSKFLLMLGLFCTVICL